MAIVLIEANYLFNLRRKELDLYIDKIKKLIHLRYDFFPYLIEAISEYLPKNEEIDNLIEIRDQARKYRIYPGWNPETQKKINQIIDSLMVEARKNLHLKKEVKFLEIEREIKKMNEVIADMIEKYNRMVNGYNNKLYNPIYFLIHIFKSRNKYPRLEYVNK